MSALAGWQDDDLDTDPGEAWQDEQERRQTAGWENGDDVRDPWPTVQIDERGRLR